MASIQNKTVLITGAASGIGFLMGQKALLRGAKHLVLWDVNEKAVLDAANQLSSLGFSASTNVVDVSNSDSVSEAANLVISERGGVDVIINNAGIVVGKPFSEHSYKEIEQTMAVNSLGIMYVTRAFLPTMIQNKKGHIVNISSAASLTPNPGMTVYAASKWAATGWSDSLRLELAAISPELRVLTVMPSYINTGMFDGVSAPKMMPLLDPNIISDKILDAIEHNKIHLREPFMVKVTPFIRGVLPAKLYDVLAGKLFKVYDSMSTFKGRKGDE
ncbi:MAG: SDR family oxidoreductase [Balneolaceae bacterium]